MAQQLFDEELTRGTHPERLRLVDLIIDPDYQRDIVPARVKAIIAKFERRALGCFIVSFRDGRYFLLDGQQRREALMQMKLGTTLVWCLVYENLSAKEESHLFDILNFGRTAVSAIYRFRNAVSRGDIKEKTIAELVRGTGWNLPLKNKYREASGNLNCVSALVECYDNAIRCDRLTAFTDMLSIVLTAYPNEVKATEGIFIKGMFLFCRTYHGQYDADRLVEVLRPVHPDHLLRQVLGQTTNRRGYSGFITYVSTSYNHGLRGKRRLTQPDTTEEVS